MQKLCQVRSATAFLTSRILHIKAKAKRDPSILEEKIE